MSNPICETCKWWGIVGDMPEDVGGAWGLCIRFPPQYAPKEHATDDDSTKDWSFPHVHSHDYCGEHQPKEETE